MSILGVLVRFTIVYLLLLVIVVVALTYLGIGLNGGVNIGVLIGSVFLVCSSFAKKNNRYFSGKEKSIVVLGFIIINIFLQYLLSMAVLSSGEKAVSSSAMLSAVLIVGLIHGLVIYFFVGFVKKSLIKQGVVNG